MEALMSEMVKFASQVDAELLGKVRDIAKAEGRQIQGLLDEALRDFVEKRLAEGPQPDAMALHRLSMTRYRSVYERLAK
jgi:hypothetical protein